MGNASLGGDITLDAKRVSTLKVVLSIDPIKYPLTGIGRYTFELAKRLADQTDIESLRYFRGSRFCDSLPTVENTQTSLMGGLRGQLLKSRLAVSLYQMTAPRMKKYALRALDDHIFHGPNFYLPSFAGRSVVTMHDLSPYVWTECHPPERVRYMQSEIELSLQRASMLITDSEFNRQEITDYFNWPREKIRAVPLASADEFYPRNAEELKVLELKYGLKSGTYCLFAGTIEPRKNLAALLDAYGMLPEPVRRRWPLVLVGYKGWNSEDIHNRILKAQREGWVKYFGFVSAEDLPLLFAGARLFTFPSLYEGFGLPVLEAMASGVPVVCSNSSSLPEVVGDAAAMCDPADVDQLSLLIATGLEDEDWRCVARVNGLKRADGFSWERCAQETVSIYQEVANS